MEKDTLEFVKEKVRHYSKLLNLDLQGWNITVSCDCIEAIQDDLLNISIKFNPNTKVAILTLFQEESMHQSKSLEEGILHELLHLKFWFVDWGEEDVLKGVLLENVINELALILSGEHR